MHPTNTIPFTLPGFAIDQVNEDESCLAIQAHSTATQAVCPTCGQLSTYIHSNYIRSPRDLPCSGRRVRLVLQVRRFRCQNEDCQRKTFAERLPQLVPVHGQRTHRLTTAASTLALELCAEASARVLHHLNMALSGDTLLRILRQLELPPWSPVRVLGIDDWAFKKGRHYGTVLVDLEQRHPIDLLPDRTAETLAHWLQAHPGIAVICRDRSQEYRAGITQGAPNAIQVADRWHLMSNLGDTLQRLLDRQPKALRSAARTAQAQIQGASEAKLKQQAEPEGAGQPVAGSPPTAAPNYRQARFAEVKALQTQGFSKRAIASRLQMHRETVARYFQIDELPKRPTPTHNVSTVTPYRDYIERRWAAGCHNTKQLWRELCAQGFSGSYMSVYRAVQRWYPNNKPRQQPLPRLSPTGKLSPRQAMWLLVRASDELTTEEQLQLAALCDCCQAVAIAYPLAQRFVQMVRQRQAHALNAWVVDAQASGLAQLRRFANGLLRDYDAVYAALLLPWSNGQTEGQVNRLKCIKRQMYGRANFDLLRLRVLHPP